MRKEAIINAAMQVLNKNKNLNSDDPLLKYLIEICAQESNDIREELKYFEEHIVDRLQEKYFSFLDSEYEFPSHTLIWCKSPNDKKLKDVVAVEKYDKFRSEDVFFTPAKPFEIINGLVVAQIIGDELQDFTEEKKVIELGETFDDIWLGFEFGNFKDFCEQEKKVSIHFQLNNEDEEAVDLDVFRKALFHSDDNKLKTSQGFSFLYDKNIPLTPFIDLVEHSIVKHYEEEFISLTFNKVKISGRAISNDLKPISELLIDNKLDKLVWVKISFFGDKGRCKNLRCRLNCFPAVNRRLLRPKTEDPSLLTSTLTFDKNEKFLGLVSLKTYPETSFQYNIETTLAKHDEISGPKFINHFATILERDFQVFKAYAGLDVSIKSIIDGHTDVIANLKDKWEEHNSREIVEENRVYLQLRCENAIKSFKCYYWVGLIKNPNLNVGAELRVENLKHLESFSKITVSPVKRTAVDLKHKNSNLKKKFGILSQNRLVTKKEIELYIKSELGNGVESITIENSAEIGKRREDGIIRVLKVCIEMDEFSSDIDLGSYSEIMESQLNSLWHGVFPIRVKIIGNSKTI